MTPEQARELRPVFEAYCEGRAVQWRYVTRGGKPCGFSWMAFGENVDLPLCCMVNEDGDETYEWRVKPEPREWWLCTNCGRAWSAGGSKNIHFGCSKPDPITVREVLP